MASLYKRPGSPFWWIKTRNTNPSSDTFGSTIRYSTGMKHGVGPDTRRAEIMKDEATLAESKTVGTNGSPAAMKAERWGEWVLNYLSAYCKSPQTIVRYTTIWRSLKMFLDEKLILTPRQLTREHCFDYMAWRMKPNKSIGKYRATHNTAQMELKIFGLIMKEAVRRSFTPFNPVRDLGIKRQRAKEKPELTDEDMAYILSRIVAEPEPLRSYLETSFQIARYQGCRLNETYLDPITDVDLGPENIIRFRIKGGKEHTAPLHPKLVPLFERLKKEQARETYTRVPNPSRKWFDFMKRIGMRKRVPGACFHSIRVSAVTKLARSKNVTESKAMRYIGHASTTVHRTYQRLRVQDLGDCIDALS